MTFTTKAYMCSRFMAGTKLETRKSLSTRQSGPEAIYYSSCYISVAVNDE
jgi:hypothetical protein